MVVNVFQCCHTKLAQFINLVVKIGKMLYSQQITMRKIVESPSICLQSVCRCFGFVEVKETRGKTCFLWWGRRKNTTFISELFVETGMRNVFHCFQEGNKHLIFVFFLIVSRLSHSSVSFHTFFREFLFCHWSLCPFQRQKDVNGVQEINICGHDENVSKAYWLLILSDLRK